MAGKTTAKPKIKKEEPKVSMTYIDDILFRLGKAEDNIDGALVAIDGRLNEITRRVDKVEARLGIG